MFKKKKGHRNEIHVEKPDHNELTQRHLDYYNEKVKQIEDKPTTANDVQAVFELSESKKKVKKARFFRKKKKANR